VVPLHLPALRDRGDDIEQIADLCVAKARQRLGRQVDGLDASARNALRSYAWPGNVRELAHMIERAVLLARHSTLTDLDLAIPGAKPRHGMLARGSQINLPVVTDVPELGDSSLDLRAALENLERQLIDRALTKAGGNRTEAAALLGLNRTTLVEKLRKYAA
jgi:DNA-binding NtrC family response regulator